MIFERSVEGIYETSVDGRLLGANPAALRMLGYASMEDYHDRVADIGSQIWIDAADRVKFLQALNSAGEVRGFETRLRRADGTLIWVSISASVEVNEFGERYVLGSLHDITERRAQQARIERLRRVEAMLSGVNSLIVRVKDRGELFREACRIAVDAGRFRLAWIALLEAGRGPARGRGAAPEFLAPGRPATACGNRRPACGSRAGGQGHCGALARCRQRNRRRCARLQAGRMDRCGHPLDERPSAGGRREGHGRICAVLGGSRIFRRRRNAVAGRTGRRHLVCARPPRKGAGSTTSRSTTG